MRRSRLIAVAALMAVFAVLQIVDFGTVGGLGAFSKMLGFPFGGVAMLIFWRERRRANGQ